MAIATLTIDIVAKLANLQTSFDRAAQLSERNARRIESSFKAARNALKTIAAGVGLQQIVQAFNGIADGLAQFKDVSEQTGIAVEELSKIEPVARGAGIALDDVAGISQKLSRALTGVDDESRGAGKALAQIGIDLASFKTLGAAEQLQTLAKALDQFADDGNKVAVVQAVLGRSGAQYLSFLKDLAQAGTLAATVTTAQARAADEYNKNLVRLQDSVRSLARELSGPVITALNRFLQQAALLDFDKILGAGRGSTFGIRTFNIVDSLRELGRQAQQTGQQVRSAELKAVADELESSFNTGGRGAPSVGTFTASGESEKKRARAVVELREATDDYARSLRRAIELERERQGVAEIEAYASAERERVAILDELAELTGALTSTELKRLDMLQEMRREAGRLNDEQYRALVENMLGTTQQVVEEVEELNDVARDLGLTFSSAFEDAIVKGDSLRDVLRGIEQDLLRIGTRKLVTEPLAGAASGLFSSLAGGRGSSGALDFIGNWFIKTFGLAGGGSAYSGRPYIVGEEGPELFVPRASGQILDANRTAAMAGRSIVVNVNVPASTSGATAQQIGATVARQLAIADSRLN